jgi:hypothetical protein
VKMSAVLYFCIYENTFRPTGVEGSEEEDEIFEAFGRASIGRDYFVVTREAPTSLAQTLSAKANIYSASIL